MSFEIRRGIRDDIDFISKIMIMAEGNGNEITSYALMFDMKDEELQPILAKLLDNESEGHTLSYKSYFVAIQDGKRAAAVCAYMEGQHGSSNGMVMSRLMKGFSRDDLKKAFNFLGQHKEITYNKELGCLHIDTGATMPGFAGKGIFSKLFNHCEETYSALGAKKSHLQVWKKNERALRLYSKLGYKIIEEKISASDPTNGKYLLEKDI